MQKMVVVGGERYRWRFEGLGAQVRYMPFKRDGGDQSLRRVIDALKWSQIGAVIILTRWFGHSAYRRISRECKKRGIALIRVRGGAGEGQEAVRALLGG